MHFFMLLRIMACALVTDKITCLLLLLLNSYDLLVTPRFIYNKAGHFHTSKADFSKKLSSMQQVLIIHQGVLQDLPVYLAIGCCLAW